MATIPRGPGGAARRAEMMRNAWGRVEKHGSTYLGPVWDYLTAHPTLTQGVYYLLLGLWPLFSMDSFLAFTGPKTDVWLVRTVAVLIAVIGATFCVAAYRRRTSPEIIVLALGCATGLAVLHLVFVLQRVVSAAYLLDAAAEVGLLTLWAYGWGKDRIARADQRPAPLPVAAPMAVPLPPTAAALPTGNAPR